MKPQKLTQALLKEGAVFWRAYVDTDPEAKKSSVLIEEWVLKSVLSRRPEKDQEPVPTAFFVEKVDGVTWVRLSKKTGDYGWSPQIDTAYRKSCHLGFELPKGLATTKSRACALEKARLEASDETRKRLAVRLNQPDPDSDPEYVAHRDQERAAIDRAIAYWKGREGKSSGK